MTKKRLIVAGVAAVAIASGTGAAIAATSNDKASEDTVLSDAAKQLGVKADDLRSALAKAEDSRLDALVKQGKITQAQAGEIKKHRQQEGTVLGFGHHGFGPGGPGPHGFGPGGPGPHGGGRFLLSDAAKAIGISESTLFTQLRQGKKLETIAKAHGKTLDEVESSVKDAATKRLDAALKAGQITKAEHDEEISHLGDEISHLGEFPRFDRRGPAGPGPMGHRGF